MWNFFAPDLWSTGPQQSQNSERLSALHYNLVRQCVPTSVPQAIFKDSARNGERKKEKFKYNEISREFLSGKWQYWSKLRVLPNVFVSVFQSVFRIIFGVTLSVLVSYCNRADSAVATEKNSPLTSFSGL